MKTVLIVTTFLVAVLAIGLIGINNNYNYNTNNIPDVFAQENTVSIVTGSSNPIAIEFCFPKVLYLQELQLHGQMMILLFIE